HDSFTVFLRKNDRRDMHDPWMNFRFTLMRVKNNPQNSIFIGKHRTVPYSHQVARLLQNGIPFMFGPRTCYMVGGSIPNTVKWTFVTVCGIRHVIFPLMFKHKGALVHTGPHLFPRL